jgi:hypothetical protein
MKSIEDLDGIVGGLPGKIDPRCAGNCWFDNVVRGAGEAEDRGARSGVYWSGTRPDGVAQIDPAEMKRGKVRKALSGF